MRRIYHPWNKWECYKSGFYNSSAPNNIDADQARAMYRDFLADLNQFESALKIVISKWKYSCEHFLTNASINRIAWLGQASACVALGLPSRFKSGFNLLTIRQQKDANNLAKRYLDIWKEKYNLTSENGKDRDIQLTFQM